MQEFADIYCGICPHIPKPPWLASVIVMIGNQNDKGERFLGFFVSSKVRVQTHSKHSKRRRHVWIWPHSSPAQLKCRTGLHRFALSWVQLGMLMADGNISRDRKIYLGEDYLDRDDSPSSTSWQTFTWSWLHETIDALTTGQPLHSEITFRTADVIQMMSKYTKKTITQPEIYIATSALSPLSTPLSPSGDYAGTSPQKMNNTL